MVDAAGHAMLGIFAPDNRFTRSYQQTGLTDSDRAAAVDWVSGRASRPAAAFEQIGGFDEAYFMYVEGWTCVGASARRAGTSPTRPPPR